MAGTVRPEAKVTSQGTLVSVMVAPSVQGVLEVQVCAQLPVHAVPEAPIKIAARADEATANTRSAVTSRTRCMEGA